MIPLFVWLFLLLLFFFFLQSLSCRQAWFSLLVLYILLRDSENIFKVSSFTK